MGEPDVTPRQARVETRRLARARAAERGDRVRPEDYEAVYAEHPHLAAAVARAGW